MLLRKELVGGDCHTASLSLILLFCHLLQIAAPGTSLPLEDWYDVLLFAFVTFPKSWDSLVSQLCWELWVPAQSLKPAWLRGAQKYEGSVDGTWPNSWPAVPPFIAAPGGHLLSVPYFMMSSFPWFFTSLFRRFSTRFRKPFPDRESLSPCSERLSPGSECLSLCSEGLSPDSESVSLLQEAFPQVQEAFPCFRKPFTSLQGLWPCVSSRAEGSPSAAISIFLFLALSKCRGPLWHSTVRTGETNQGKQGGAAAEREPCPARSPHNTALD